MIRHRAKQEIRRASGRDRPRLQRNAGCRGLRNKVPRETDLSPAYTGTAGYPGHPYIPPMRLLRTCAPLLSALLFVSPLAAQKATNRPPAKTPARPAAKDTTPAKPAEPDVPKFGYLQGIAVDSIHGDPLAGALVQVEGS